jgi:hypothetical protein
MNNELGFSMLVRATSLYLEQMKHTSYKLAPAELTYVLSDINLPAVDRRLTTINNQQFNNYVYGLWTKKLWTKTLA